MNKIMICIDRQTLDNELGKKYAGIIEYVKNAYSFEIIENDVLYDYKFLEDKYSEYDFVLIFNSKEEYKNVGKLIYYSIDIYNLNKETLKNNNFSDFAKTKLMYNDLSDVYMELIANDTDKEIEFIDKVFESNNNRQKKLIDFCCGVGRHVYGLANKGYAATGVDVSERQIETAKKVHAHENIKYHVGDAKNIKVDDTFNMAICMWTTYNYFSKDEEFSQFISNVYDHLNDDGLLILDAKNVPSLEDFRIYNRSRYNERIDLDQLIIKRIINGNIQNSQYFLFIKKNGNCKFVMDEEFVRYYSLEEIRNLTKDKFEIVCTYGDFDMVPYNSERSGRMIVVLKKISK